MAYEDFWTPDVGYAPSGYNYDTGYTPPPTTGWSGSPEGQPYGGSGVVTGLPSAQRPSLNAGLPSDYGSGASAKASTTQYKPITGLTQVTSESIKEGIPFPEMGAAPTFTAPKRSEERLMELSRKLTSSRERALRKTTKAQLLRQHYDDPRYKSNVAAILDAMSGGLGTIYTGAFADAFKMREAEFATQMAESQMNFQVAVNKWTETYKGKMQQYLANLTKSTTTKRDYSYTPGGAGSRESGTVDRFYGLSGGRSYTKATVWG